MNKDTSRLIDNISTVVVALTLFLLPTLFLTATTDFFVIPKQLLIIGSTTLLLILWGVRQIVEKKLTINANPLNLPVAIFGVVVLISAVISQNRYDSLIQAVPVAFAVLLFFAIVNSVRQTKAFGVVLGGLVLGAAVSALITVAYYFKLYFLPIPAIQSPAFNTFGSIVQQLIYLLPILVFSVFYIAREVSFPKVRIPQQLKTNLGFFIQAVAGIVVVVGVALIIYEIVFSPQKPIVLPYIYGFQIASAVITQNAERFVQSLLFGSGYGTFLVDFTRFKLPAFNLETSIWNLSFSFSSSYFLELISTTGILGAISFIFMIVSVIRTRTTRSPLFFSIVILLILAFVLPFAYPSVALLFVLLGIYVAYLNLASDRRVYDVILSIVAAKNGMFAFDVTPEDEVKRKKEGPILPILVFIILIVVLGFSGFYTFQFASSDVTFTQSLRAAQANNGQQTYQLQAQAINTFPYRSDYHRIFSQVNLALANSISQGIPQGSSPSAQVQQNVVTLLQQAIGSARNAVTVAPLTAINWENLGQIYRSLIGVGQNADQFAVASLNQAIALDPYNPQLYVELGGIYYQLKQWDQAQAQFQTAISLKRDYSNAYYNLGHVLEEKNQLADALSVYQIVKQLSGDNKANLERIDSEIDALQAKIGNNGQATNNQNVTPETEDQTPLDVNGEPTTALPTQQPPIKISPPPGEEAASKSAR